MLTREIIGAAMEVANTAKTIDQLGAIERGRMINYLSITRLAGGLTINFKHPKITWDRVVL